MTTNRTTATALQALADCFGEERDELGDIVAEVAGDGAKLLDPVANRLMRELLLTMPNNDSMTLEDIARNIEEVGTDYARDMADAIRDHIR